MHFGDQWAGRVDNAQVARLCVAAYLRRNAVRGEDANGALGNLALGVHEDGATLFELLDDVAVVDDLFSDVNGLLAGLESALDDLHRPIDAGAVSARGRQQDFFFPCFHRSWRFARLLCGRRLLFLLTTASVEVRQPCDLAGGAQILNGTALAQRALGVADLAAVLDKEVGHF